MLSTTTHQPRKRLACWFVFYLAVFWLLSGCRLPAPSPVQPISSHYPSAAQETNIAEETTLLPGPLYLLRQDANGLPQVWRISPNGSGLLQLTFSSMPVRDYDISSTGRLAYLAGSSLIVKPLSGDQDQTWVTSPEDMPDTYPHAPRWSPDGKTLAYYAGGVWLRQENESRMLYPDPTDGSQRTFPYSWSPDGQRLLVSQDHPSGTTLAVLEVGTGNLVPLSYAPLCCQATWTPDSQGLFIANPYPQQGPSGLWWASISNMAAPLLPWQAEDGTYNIVGWPHVNQNGLLGYAFANYPDLPPDTFPLGLYTANVSSPNQRQALRLESYFFREVLWTEDGRRALLVIPPPGASSRQASGPVVLVTAGEQPGIVLTDSGYNLKWGP